MNDITLSTAEAADLLGVHPSTAKRWLDDFGRGVERTDGGHRRIPLTDLLVLAETRGGSTVLTPFRPFEAHAWAAIRDEEEGTASSFAPLALGWLLYSDPRRIGLLFEVLARRERLSLEALVDGPLTTFMHAIGDAWRDGRIRIADEHLVTQMMADTLVRLGADWSRAVATRADAPVAIVACAEGNQHELGALAVRASLERHGWRAWYLGANVPMAEVISAQRSQDASVVCLSFGASQDAPDVHRCLEIAERYLDGPAPFTLVLGGPERAVAGATPRTRRFGGLQSFESTQSFATWLKSHPETPR
ncbi:MAG: cobalamin-dependent protein [Gemmatimonadota bacterium]